MLKMGRVSIGRKTSVTQAMYDEPGVTENDTSLLSPSYDSSNGIVSPTDSGNQADVSQLTGSGSPSAGTGPVAVPKVYFLVIFVVVFVIAEVVFVHLRDFFISTEAKEVGEAFGQESQLRVILFCLSSSAVFIA